MIKKTSFLFALLLSVNLLAAEHWDGNEYRQTNTIQEAWAKPIMDKVQLKEGDSILDLGCGDGRLTKQLALRAGSGEVVGLDLSSSMIAAANGLVDDSLKGRLSFVNQDAAQFALDKRFDVVTSFTALHWVKDHDSVVKNASMHLRTGGKLYFLFPIHWNLFTQFMEAKRSIEASPKYSEWLKDFSTNLTLESLDGYVPRLLKNGFSIDRISFEPKDSLFPSPKEARAWVKAWLFAEYPQIPVEMREEFVSDFMHYYLEQPGALDAQGHVHWYGFMAEISATKVASN